MLRLISHSRCPPGEFYYVQTEGLPHTFVSTPLIRELAKTVVEFRKGNSLPRASLGDVLSDIDAFTCARLGNDPRWVYDSDQPLAVTSPILQAPKRGGCCGARVT